MTKVRARTVAYMKLLDEDAGRAVTVARTLGGNVFLGREGLFSGFEIETDAEQFLLDMVEAGVQVDTMIVRSIDESGGKTYVGYAPTVVYCEKCCRKMLLNTTLSRTGQKLCDKCLARMIEAPIEDEGEDEPMGLMDDIKKKFGSKAAEAMADKPADQENAKANMTPVGLSPGVVDKETLEVEQKAVESEGPAMPLIPDDWDMGDLVERIDLFDDWILITAVEHPDKTKGGIVLPGKTRKRFGQGLYQVLKCGPGKIVDSHSGATKRAPVQPGDFVMIKRDLEIAFEWKEKVYHLAQTFDICGRVNLTPKAEPAPQVEGSH